MAVRPAKRAAARNPPQPGRPGLRTRPGEGRPAHDARPAPGHGVQPQGPAQPARREPPPRGPAPGARPGPGDLRPVRRHRRPRPPQGDPGAVPALADAPAAARVHDRRRRPSPVHGRGVPRGAQGLPRHVLARPARGPRDLGRPRRAASSTTGATSATRRSTRGSRTGWTSSTRSAAPAATGSSISPASRRPSRRSSRGLGRVGPGPRAPRGRLAAGRHREAVRAGPQLRDPPQPGGGQGLPGAAGLPHRPLPGQGDGAEPAGLPVRQRDLRADLEPPPHRPRADHGGRVHRHRGPRRVLRGDRRQPRLPPEPPAPAAEPGGHGAAGDLRGRCAARREGQGDPRDPRADPGAGDARRRPRPVRAGLGVREARGGLPRGAGGGPGVRDGDLRRRPAHHRRLALVRRPVLPAHGQAAAQARDGDRDPVQGGPAPAVQGQRERPRGRTCSRCGSSPTRGSCCASAPRSPGWASTSAT